MDLETGRIITSLPQTKSNFAMHILYVLVSDPEVRMYLHTYIPLLYNVTIVPVILNCSYVVPDRNKYRRRYNRVSEIKYTQGVSDEARGTRERKIQQFPRVLVLNNLGVEVGVCTRADLFTRDRSEGVVCE